MVVFLALCVLVLITLLIVSKRQVRRLKLDLVVMEEKHRQEFQDLISKVNHENQIPIASTAQGLTGLISWALTKCLSLLADLRERQDWNTLSVTREILGIRNVEVFMLDAKLRDLIESIRKVLDDYNHKQEHRKL